jgi:hypothetical protein
MALISKPNTFSAGATIIASEHNSNFDTIYNDYNGNITDANISDSAAIADSKLAQITTANKVDTSAITNDALKVTNVLMTEGAAVSTGAGEGALYLKDTSGQPELFFREESDGDEVQLTSGGVVVGGAIVQVVNTITGAVATGTTAFPNDDTIPQITEGDQYMTLAITPTSATNNLRIDVVAYIAHSGDSFVSGALFQDATEGALACMQSESKAANSPNTIVFTHFMAAGTTSATTFRFRAGAASGATTTFNGVSGSRKLGGKLASSITITEIAA